MPVLDRWFAIKLLAVLALVPLTVLSPLAAVAAAVAGSAVLASVRAAPWMHRAFLGALGVLLVGYAFLGRGFAYLGAPPLYVGEAVLALGLLALLVRGGHPGVLRSPIAWTILAVMALGAVAAVPHLGRYGLDVLRDSVIWGYALFALLVATCLLREDAIGRTLRSYARVWPWYLAWAPVALTIAGFVALPTVPGTNVTVVDLKAGDAGVHLAGVLLFLLLGLHRSVLALPPRALTATSFREWGWWALWLVGAGLVFTISRGAMLSILVAVVVVLAMRPLSRWGKLALVALVLGTSFMASEIEIVHEARRPFSSETLVQNVRSLFEATDGDGRLDGTANWRLSWWEDVVGYTIFGDHFWTGKGFGVNLAASDGYLTSAGNNRNPHNGHVTILARGGVPALAVWILFLATFGIALLRAHLRARRAGRRDWADLNLWVLGYWVAFLVNGTFDVFLEGPQGGIWFWSLVGFGIALLTAQGQGRPSPFAAEAPPATGPRPVESDR